MARKKSILGMLFGSSKKSKSKTKSKSKAKPRPESQAPAQQKTQSSNPAMTYVYVPKSADTLHIPEGENECAVYVYDGRPLKGTRKGSKFTLDIVCGDITMQSIYTGTIWTESNCCLSRNGCAIGFLSGINLRAVKDCVSKYKHVTIVAKREGTDPDGWPIITALLPDIE
jgi:hypothetical protein